MAVLPDINVLLPLIYGAHVHHAAAAAWLDTVIVPQNGEIILCRVSQLGVLRLLNNTVAMGTDAQSGSEVWEIWDALIADQRFRFADEPEGFEAQFRALTAGFAHQPKRWQDAYLAAFALAMDVELVTFDTGFRSFPGCATKFWRPKRPPRREPVGLRTANPSARSSPQFCWASSPLICARSLPG
jgi:toxin-antitoxin system PIN domain toxin